jgi:phosphatidylglycerol:prolipoprotein diacylglycerol transferase
MQPLFPFWERVVVPIGPLDIHGFGILVALGFVFGSRVARNKAARDGLDPELINQVVSWIVAGVFIGGHLGHLLFYFPEEMANDPQKFVTMFKTLASGSLPTADSLPELLKVWRGLSSFGGFIATVFLIWLFFRKRNLTFWVYGDAIAYGMMTGWMLGRMGCFVAHDHPGIETNFWLGVAGICPTSYGNPAIACHDLGLYEAIWAGVMAIWFAMKDKVPRHSGYFVGWMCVSYGPVRFVMDQFRHIETDTRYFDLTPAQYLSMAVTVLGIWILRSRRNEPPMRGDWVPEDAAV